MGSPKIPAVIFFFFFYPFRSYNHEIQIEEMLRAPVLMVKRFTWIAEEI